jgi:hypothetical protein
MPSQRRLSPLSSNVLPDCDGRSSSCRPSSPPHRVCCSTNLFDHRWKNSGHSGVFGARSVTLLLSLLLVLFGELPWIYSDCLNPLWRLTFEWLTEMLRRAGAGDVPDDFSNIVTPQTGKCIALWGNVLRFHAARSTSVLPKRVERVLPERHRTVTFCIITQLLSN